MLEKFETSHDKKPENIEKKITTDENKPENIEKNETENEIEKPYYEILKKFLENIEKNDAETVREALQKITPQTAEMVDTYTTMFTIFKKTYDTFKERICRNEAEEANLEAELSYFLEGRSDQDGLYNQYGLTKKPQISTALDIQHITINKIIQQAKENAEKPSQNIERTKMPKEVQDEINELLENPELKIAVEEAQNMIKTTNDDEQKEMQKEFIKRKLNRKIAESPKLKEWLGINENSNLPNNIQSTQAYKQVINFIIGVNSSHPLAAFFKEEIEITKEKIKNQNISENQKTAMATYVVADSTRNQHIIQTTLDQLPETITDEQKNILKKGLQENTLTDQQIESCCKNVPSEQKEEIIRDLQKVRNNEELLNRVYQPESQMLVQIVQQNAYNSETVLTIIKNAAQYDETLKQLYEKAIAGVKNYLLKAKNVGAFFFTEEEKQASPALAETAQIFQDLNIPRENIQIQQNTTGNGEKIYKGTIRYYSKDIDFTIAENSISFPDPLTDNGVTKISLDGDIESNAEAVQKVLFTKSFDQTINEIRKREAEDLSFLNDSELYILSKALFYKKLDTNIDLSKKPHATVLTNLVNLLVTKGAPGGTFESQEERIKALIRITRNAETSRLLRLALEKPNVTFETFEDFMQNEENKWEKIRNQQPPPHFA